jgi:hypothetical protein
MTIPQTQTGPSRSIDSIQNGSQTIRKLKLNHPKNYLAAPLAIAAEGDRNTLISEYAVNLPKRVLEGATALELLDQENCLTPLGQAVVSMGYCEYGSPKAALTEIASLKYSQQRFTEELPEWHHIAERVAFRYTPTALIVEILQEQNSLTLAELTRISWSYNPNLTTEIFLYPDRINSDHQDSPPSYSTLVNTEPYRCEPVFQFKAYLYHSGILTQRGTYKTKLDPETDRWKLSEKHMTNK